jgi:hypothetical protein
MVNNEPIHYIYLQYLIPLTKNFGFCRDNHFELAEMSESLYFFLSIPLNFELKRAKKLTPNKISYPMSR